MASASETLGNARSMVGKAFLQESAYISQSSQLFKHIWIHSILVAGFSGREPLREPLVRRSRTREYALTKPSDQDVGHKTRLVVIFANSRHRGPQERQDAGQGAGAAGNRVIGGAVD